MDQVHALVAQLQDLLQLNEPNESQIDDGFVTKDSIVSDTANALGASTASQQSSPLIPTILCDFGYGLPKEARPRKEKLLAIAKQLVNFLEWQHQVAAHVGDIEVVAQIKVVGCRDEDVMQALEGRVKELWNKNNPATEFPQTIQFLHQSLEDAIQGCSPTSAPVYLSPDAESVLDPSKPPPTTVVVGLLIDRRIQVNRSLQRADQLDLPTVRLPLESVSILHPNEPLNVDCILEMMQAWYWNSQDNNDDNINNNRFNQAAAQALQHHLQRHPGRPQHKMCPE